jgi:hypothetical protein
LKLIKRDLRGAILVELAFSIPVLIGILYLMMDAPKYSRIYYKMKFCSYVAVNMVQYISQERENKIVTKEDMSYIFAIAPMPFFGASNRQYGSPTKHQLGYWSYGKLYYIKGTAHNRGKIMWCLDSNCHGGTPGSVQPVVMPKCSFSSIAGTFDTEYQSGQITPELTIEKDEVRMLYEISLVSASGVKDSNEETIWSGSIPPSSLFNFYVLTPGKTFTSSTYYPCFTVVTIFTPKKGLFTETPPPSASEL